MRRALGPLPLALCAVPRASAAGCGEICWESPCPATCPCTGRTQGRDYWMQCCPTGAPCGGIPPGPIPTCNHTGACGHAGPPDAAAPPPPPALPLAFVAEVRTGNRSAAQLEYAAAGHCAPPASVEPSFTSLRPDATSRRLTRGGCKYGSRSNPDASIGQFEIHPDGCCTVKNSFGNFWAYGWDATADSFFDLSFPPMLWQIPNCGPQLMAWPAGEACSEPEFVGQKHITPFGVPVVAEAWAWIYSAMQMPIQVQHVAYIARDGAGGGATLLQWDINHGPPTGGIDPPTLVGRLEFRAFRAVPAERRAAFRQNFTLPAECIGAPYCH